MVSGVDSTPPAVVSATYGPTFVGAQFYDIKRMEATLGWGNAGFVWLVRRPDPAGAAHSGHDFSVRSVWVSGMSRDASALAGSSAQAEAKTTTVITNMPFPQVAFFAYDGNYWQFLGTTVGVQGSNPSIFDQGTDRFWTYTSPTFTSALVSTQTVVAVGMSAAGDGLATLGCVVP